MPAFCDCRIGMRYGRVRTPSQQGGGFRPASLATALPMALPNTLPLAGRAGEGVATGTRIGANVMAPDVIYARKLPPVALVTAATILAEIFSISSSVSVFSCGCRVTAMATDFLPSPT
jgi:hypothetical protein